MLLKTKLVLFSFCVFMYMLNVNGNEVIYDCEPGEEFQDLCNKCICSPDGLTAACTRKACNGDIKCTPGITVRSKCNYCTCSPKGQVTACTKMSCSYRS